MQIKMASVDSIIIYFSNEISKQTSILVQNAYKILKEQKSDALIEIIPSYSSILVTYDIFVYDFEEMVKYVEVVLSNIPNLESQNREILTIDVYYGDEVGLDLVRVSILSHLSVEEVILKHSTPLYDICAIGFLPGFAYLASVDDSICIPRLESPRKMVDKGSVAIANNETAVYPQNSPGGWNIIGKTTYELFDKTLENLTPLSLDLKIKFNPISKEQFVLNGGIL